MSSYKTASNFFLLTILSATVYGIALLSTSVASAQNVLRIAAVVNDRVVSALDVVHRMRFVMVSTQLPNTAETRKRLTPQIIRSLVDEQIQLQESNQHSGQ